MGRAHSLGYMGDQSIRFAPHRLSFGANGRVLFGGFPISSLSAHRGVLWRVYDLLHVFNRAF